MIRREKSNFSLEYSREIWLPRRISSNFETIGICTFFDGNGGSAGHLANFEWLTVCHMSGAD